MKHSKMNCIGDSYRTENYSISSNISTEEKQTLFKFRTRMVDVKSNFKSQYGNNLTCYFCSSEDTQLHILSCKEVAGDINMSGAQYDDIFSDLLIKQEKIAKILNKILKQRNLKMKLLSTNKNLSQ